MHQQQPPTPPHSAPPQWMPFVRYQPGVISWYGGTIWRCEVLHTSGAERGGAPTSNMHLWTPISSSGYYQSPVPSYQPPPYGYYAPSPYSQYPQTSFAGAYVASSSPHPGYQGYNPSPPGQSPQPSRPSSFHEPPPILSPVPLPMPSKPPSPGLSPLNEKHSDSSDSSSSTETVKDEYSKSSSEKRSLTSSFARMNPFLERASEGLRYLTYKEERKKAVELEELKKELEGKRIWKVAGIGMWTYDLDRRVEDVKESAWKEWGRKGKGREDWLKTARARTEFYARDSRGIKPLIMWKLVERGQGLPDDALPIGKEEDGRVLFSARAWWEGGLHLGKAGAHLINSASISYAGSEHSLDVYEVLCGPSDPDLCKWMTFRHGERAGVQGWQPVEGGREKDGAALLVAKGEYENGVHPGKCLLDDDHACVGYGGGELWVRPFQVLAYSSAHPR